MKLTGTANIANAPTVLTFNGEVSVFRTIDQPARTVTTPKGTQTIPGVCVAVLSNRNQITIAGDDYVKLCAKWATDDDLLAFIAQKFNLTVS